MIFSLTNWFKPKLRIVLEFEKDTEMRDVIYLLRNNDYKVDIKNGKVVVTK